MITPTIGRVVLVHRYGLSDQPEPALICYVHNDRMINVGGFDRNGAPFAITSVCLLQDGDQVPANSGWPYAEWMPYQKGQAAKTEALEKTIFETAAAARAAGPEVKY